MGRAETEAQELIDPHELGILAGVDEWEAQPSFDWSVDSVTALKRMPWLADNIDEAVMCMDAHDVASPARSGRGIASASTRTANRRVRMFTPPKLRVPARQDRQESDEIMSAHPLRVIDALRSPLQQCAFASDVDLTRIVPRYYPDIVQLSPRYYASYYYSTHSRAGAKAYA